MKRRESLAGLPPASLGLAPVSGGVRGAPLCVVSRQSHGHYFSMAWPALVALQTAFL
jgi:hypothetical protein